MLISEGFSKPVATALAKTASEETILRQIELLPYRNASKNKLGLLRKAIEENWPAPEGIEKTKDVFSSPGRVFAAHFYAGYHGNPEEPVSEPSLADIAAAESFVTRLLSVDSDENLVSVWGRDFGALVVYRHHEKRRHLPVLQPAIRQFGDEFFIRLKASVEADRKKRTQERMALHVSRFREVYNKYLAQQFTKHEADHTPLFQELLREEEESFRSIRSNKFGLDTEAIVRRMQSRETVTLIDNYNRLTSSGSGFAHRSPHQDKVGHRSRPQEASRRDPGTRDSPFCGGVYQQF